MAEFHRTLVRRAKKALAYAPVAVGRSLLIRSYEHPNWGDALAPVLAQEISGRPAINLDGSNPLHRPVFSLTGSILGWKMRGDPADHVIWGAGFMYPDEELRGVPGRICAVRGPLTRARCLDLGVECPEVFGDPALLYPRYYRPSPPKQFDIGVIPHFNDKDSAWVAEMRAKPEVNIIDVTGGVRAFVDDLLRCRAIASSSLHGVIAADAYGLPSVWIELSDRVEGDGFKFRDYFASVHKPVTEPVIVDSSTTITEVVDRLDLGGIDIDLDRLMAACPLPS